MAVDTAKAVVEIILSKCHSRCEITVQLIRLRRLNQNSFSAYSMCVSILRPLTASILLYITPSKHIQILFFVTQAEIIDYDII